MKEVEYVAELIIITGKICVFFFQAEDGIRDRLVTGVQTCALPIFFSFASSGVSNEAACAMTSHFNNIWSRDDVQSRS